MPERRLHYAFNSLLGEILLWILTLLLFLWGLSVVMTYQVAASIANHPYDERLADDVRGLVGLLQQDGDRIVLNFPGQARDILRADSKDRIYFQVADLDGHWIAGDKDLPSAEVPEKLEADQIRFRDDEFNGDEIRVAYQYLNSPAGTGHPALLIQVAETRVKRQGLAAAIVSGVIVPQFVIVPMAVLLVYLGLTHGITPLQRLQQELRGRRPSDLSPISVQGIPEEIRPLIEALNGVMLRLTDSLESQRRFTADAAHQLKTPLTGLRTQTELALLENDPQSMRKGLEQVALSAEQLSRLIQQLLALARAEATGDRGDTTESLDLDNLARAATTEWVDRSLAKGVDIGFESEGLPLYIQGNSFLLHELLTNLLDNALKYTPSGGHITVRTLKTDGSVIVEVEDSGIGIPLEERPRVFERFFRVLGTETDGSGLGLAIVKEVAELHRGQVEVADPESGRGTLFRVRIPAEGTA